MDSSFNSELANKLTIFIIAIVSFYFLARWASRKSESSAPRFDELKPDTDHTPMTFDDNDEGSMLTPNPEAQIHPAIDFGTLVLERLWFSTFNALDGPPDPTAFCDEVTVRIMIKADGREFEDSFVVATPEGMRKTLKERKWATMFLPNLLIVNRYDLKEIREAVIDRIKGDDPDTIEIVDTEKPS